MASTHTIMSTTSSWKPHHQVVGKWKRLEACKLAGESTLGRETLCFYRYGGSWVAYRLCVSSIGSCQKARETAARARFAFQNVQKLSFHNLLSSSDPRPDTLSWHTIWNLEVFLASVLILSDILSGSIWHLLWHSFWQMFWHSVWQSFLHLLNLLLFFVRVHAWPTVASRACDIKLGLAL